MKIHKILNKTQSANKPLRVAAYCRVSSKSEEQESSYEIQVAVYTQLINSTPGWTLAGIYADYGITGTLARRRTEFLRMVKDCEAGLIDVILCKSLSRFSRNTLDALSYVRRLKALGIRLIFEKESIDTIDPKSEMLITVFAAFAQEEIHSLSDNVKWGKRKRVENGYELLIPAYGYRKNAEGTNYEIIPEEAETVRDIFNMYEHGVSVPQIVNELLARGIKPPYFKTSKAEKWDESRIHYIIQNEKYAGDLICQKFYTADYITHRVKRNDKGVVPSRLIKDHHEAIISRKQFERVTAIRSMKRRQHCREDDVMGVCDQYPLGEKLRCPYCGSVLYQRAVHVQVRQGKGWSCERGEKACKEFIIRSQFVESALLRAYNELNVKAVRRKLENNAATNSAKLKRIKKAAEVMLAIKEKIPAFDTIDYWWVDELVDHIEFGEHSKTQRELLRLKALKKARTSEGKEGAAEESVEQAIIDDRTMRVFWRCGIVSTVPSGVLADKDNPRYVAKLFNDAQQREQDNTLTSENGEARIRRGKKVKTDNQQAEDNQC